MPTRAMMVAEPEWADLYEVGVDGSVLVCPDGHVAWRCRTRQGEPAQTMAAVLPTVTGH